MGGPGPPLDADGGEFVPRLAGRDAARWVRPANVLWRRTTTAVALLPPGSDAPLILTGSGALLWDLLTASLTLPDAAALLAERHGVDPALVTADVAPVLEELARAGALVPAGGAP